MASKKPPTPAQKRARAEFARRAKAGTLKKGSKLRTKRSAKKSTSTKRRAARTTKRRTTTTRRKSSAMPRKKTSRRRTSKKTNILTLLAGTAALAEIILEFANAGIVDAVRSRNLQRIAEAFLAGNRNVMDMESLWKILGPIGIVKLYKFALKTFKQSAPTVGSVRFA